MIWAGAVMIWAGACSNTNFPTLKMPKNAKKAKCDGLTDRPTDGRTDRPTDDVEPLDGSGQKRNGKSAGKANENGFRCQRKYI